MFAAGNEFNGGGFMPSPEGQAAGGGTQKKNYDQQNQTVRKVTIKQIHTCLEHATGDNLVIDGKEIANVAVIGKVLSVRDDNVTLHMIIDDGTGRITTKIYVSAGDDLERQSLAELREGIYVKIFGHMSTYNNERQINAFSARPITDFNEVTYHLSQVIFQHLQLTKGGAEVSGVPVMPKMEGGFGGPAPAAAAPATFGGGGAFTPIQSEILNIFNAPDAMSIEAGLGIPDVIARSGNRYNQQQVMSAVTFLVDEGHLYSTIDDAHWKSCNS